MFHIQLLLLLLRVSHQVLADDKGGKNVGTVIGIDLGTTYSCVGVFRYGRVEIIANDQGKRVTPSYVAFTQEGERLIGDAAKNQLTSNPENTIFNVKRLIGRSWNEETVQSDTKLLPFAVVEQNEMPYIKVNTKNGETTFAAEEISAMILGKMKRIAESYLGETVTHAVVTVPAYFNDAQRRATRDAGVIAGLNVVKILNEPTAAAIAYGLDKKEETKNILVYDLGGGTFDVSILKIDNGVFTAVATNGDTHLGGEDFDQRVVDYFINMYKAKTGNDVTKDKRAVQKLRREVEKAKRILSSQLSTKVEVESFYEGDDFSFTLTRAKFEYLNMDLFLSTMEPVRKVLQDSGFEKRQIHEIVLVGGSTRIQKIQQLVKKFFNDTEPSRGINPDEAVAYGAAVQAAVGWNPNFGDLVLIDICPLSLGISTRGEFMTKVILRNTPVPVKKSEMFTTLHDDQQIVEFPVLEGESELSKENHLLGNFYLTGVRLAPAGVPKIEVTFEIDSNGILKVTAEDQETKNKEGIIIKNDDNRLSIEDIKRMMEDVKTYVVEEAKVKEIVEAKSELEEYAYMLKNNIDDKTVERKLSSGDKNAMKQAVEKALKWLDEHQEAERDEFDAQKEKLKRVVQPIIAKNDQVFRDMDEL